MKVTAPVGVIEPTAPPTCAVSCTTEPRSSAVPSGITLWFAAWYFVPMVGEAFFTENGSQALVAVEKLASAATVA